MTASSPRWRATLAALCGNAIFGFSFMFSRLALNVASPFVMLMYRFGVAFGVLSLVALWAAGSGRQDWLRFQLHWRKIGPLVARGLVQPVVYFAGTYCGSGRRGAVPA